MFLLSSGLNGRHKRFEVLKWDGCKDYRLLVLCGTMYCGRYIPTFRMLNWNFRLQGWMGSMRFEIVTDMIINITVIFGECGTVYCGKYLWTFRRNMRSPSSEWNAKQGSIYGRFQFLTAVALNIAAVWDVAMCTACFGATCYLYFRHRGNLFLIITKSPPKSFIFSDFCPVTALLWPVFLDVFVITEFPSLSTSHFLYVLQSLLLFP